MGSKENPNNFLALSVMSISFFMFGFLTALNDILIPHLKAIFNLNYAEAMMVQFCFFSTYAIMSIPLARYIERYGYKSAIVSGFVIAGLGCVLFCPAASIRVYSMFLIALFILATGVVLLQVAANPYITLIGPSKTASQRLTLVQAFNSVGTAVAPSFGAWLILGKLTEILPSDPNYDSIVSSSVQTPYLLLASIMLILGFLVSKCPLPKVESEQKNDHAEQKSVWEYPHLVLGCIAIFTYVGAEVSIGSFLVSYLSEGPEALFSMQSAAYFVSFYWGGAMVGRFMIGGLLMGRFKPQHIISVCALSAASLVALSTSTTGMLSAYTIVLVGLCNSIMFPTIFSLAVKNLGPLTAKASGILCVSIVGGAIIPVFQGMLADMTSLAVGMLIPIACYAYILFYGLKGHRSC